MGLSFDQDLLLLEALADPARLAIVRRLADDREVCACDLTACCGVRQPTVSHHLKVLRSAGVILGERRGTWIYYSLDPGLADRLRLLAARLALPIAARREGAPARAAPRRRGSATVRSPDRPTNARAAMAGEPRLR